MKIALSRTALAAALHCAAKGDVRYHLNGVYVGFPNMERAEIVGTTGHVLFACVVPYTSLEKPVCPGFSTVIPRDTIAAACKEKDAELTLEALPDGRYMLGSHAFTPTEGTFPDFRRVIPNPRTAPQAPANYNPELLLQCRKALVCFRGTSKAAHPFELTQFGTAAGVMHDGRGDCLALCMPLVVPREGPYVYAGLDTVDAMEPQRVAA